jgi:hypothetical protein
LFSFDFGALFAKYRLFKFPYGATSLLVDPPTVRIFAGRTSSSLSLQYEEKYEKKTRKIDVGESPAEVV